MFPAAHGELPLTPEPEEEPASGRAGAGVDLFLQTSYGQERFDLRLAKIGIGNTPR